MLSCVGLRLCTLEQCTCCGISAGRQAHICFTQTSRIRLVSFLPLLARTAASPFIQPWIYPSPMTCHVSSLLLSTSGILQPYRIATTSPGLARHGAIPTRPSSVTINLRDFFRTVSWKRERNVSSLSFIRCMGYDGGRYSVGGEDIALEGTWAIRSSRLCSPNFSCLL